MAEQSVSSFLKAERKASDTSSLLSRFPIIYLWANDASWSSCTKLTTFKRGNNGCPEGGRKVIMVLDFACGSSKCEDC